MAQLITYGPGGYDKHKPNNNIVSTAIVPDSEPSEIDTLKARIKALEDVQIKK